MIRLPLQRYFPRGLKAFLQRVYDSQRETLDLLTGRRQELTPPRRLQFDGGDWSRVGKEFLRYFVELGHVRPNHHVLDVGCGIGRMAVPLTRYLSADGRYEGFDIVKKGIDWCRIKITSRYPHFQFRHADVYSKFYNAQGRCRASEYPFPYPDGSFDFIFLTSVFTHMLAEDLAHYFSEISRVLKPAGRCFMTYFLLNVESRKCVSMGKSPWSLSHALGEARIAVPELPESVVAYDETFILRLYEKHGLRPIESVHYGSWCGRERFLSFQDIIIGVHA